MAKTMVSSAADISAVEKLYVLARAHMEAAIPALALTENISLAVGTIAPYGNRLGYCGGGGSKNPLIMLYSDHPKMIQYLSWRGSKVIVTDETYVQGILRHEIAHIFQALFRRQGIASNYTTHKSDDWLKVITSWAEGVYGAGVFLSFEELKKVRYLSHKQILTDEADIDLADLYKSKFTSFCKHIHFDLSRAKLEKAAKDFRSFIAKAHKVDANGKQVRNTKTPTNCAVCGVHFIAKSAKAKFCSPAHRMQNYLENKAAKEGVK